MYFLEQMYSIISNFFIPFFKQTLLPWHVLYIFMTPLLIFQAHFFYFCNTCLFLKFRHSSDVARRNIFSYITAWLQNPFTTETSGNLWVLYLDYMVDVSKLFGRTHLIFGESSKKCVCVIEHRRVEDDTPMIKLSHSLGIISQVAKSTVPNQSFHWAVTVNNERFPFSPHHTHSIVRQSRFWSCSRSFTSLLPWFPSNNILIVYPFFASYDSLS